MLRKVQVGCLIPLVSPTLLALAFARRTHSILSSYDTVLDVEDLVPAIRY